MARRKRHEEHVNHEAWAIPYGDLVTLLLAFFVVMYSISSVNEGKYKVLSDSMVAAFQGAPKTIQPIQIGDNHPVGTADKAKSATMSPEMASRSPYSAPLVPEPQAYANRQESLADTPAALLEVISDEIRVALTEMIELDQVRIRETPLWLEVEINTDLLFPVGVAQVAAVATPTLAKLAQVLLPFPNKVRVEGHTDDVPINTQQFPSNWELSAARAGSVVRFFQDRGVAPIRMAAIGLAEFSPVSDNTTTEGRNSNRRVKIIILANAQAPGDFINDKPGEA